MIEIETVLMPITYGSEQAERYLGIAQVLTDVSPLIGRSITFERLVSSALVREDETLTTIELPPSAPPPPRAVNEDGQRHPRAPHLRLVVSHQGNAAARRDVLQMDSHETLQKLFDLCGATASYQGQ
jgi:hypothetical protein